MFVMFIGVALAGYRHQGNTNVEMNSTGLEGTDVGMDFE